MEATIGRKEGMVHIGTGKGEIWRGWDELHKATAEQFKKLEYYKANIHNLRINIAESGDVAWYSHILNARVKSDGKERMLKEARFTGILEKTSGRWVILQTHVSGVIQLSAERISYSKYIAQPLPIANGQSVC